MVLPTAAFFFVKSEFRCVHRRFKFRHGCVLECKKMNGMYARKEACVFFFLFFSVFFFQMYSILSHFLIYVDNYCIFAFYFILFL